jgi:hypothetical protein
LPIAHERRGGGLVWAAITAKLGVGAVIHFVCNYNGSAITSGLVEDASRREGWRDFKAWVIDNASGPTDITALSTIVWIPGRRL